jgi:NADH dehydrogenase
VTDVSESGVRIGGERIRARTVLWAAGNQASPLGAALCRQTGLVPDRAGRVPVAPDLTLPGHPDVFIVGDLARVDRAGGAGDLRPDAATIPAVAPAAMQQGRHAGANVVRRIAGHPTRAFAYVDKGELATIGRHRAVASLFGGRLRLQGWVAWWFWLALHLGYLIGFRNRLSVLLQWSYAYLFAGRGARLIVSRVNPKDAPPSDAAPSDAAPRTAHPGHSNAA